MNILGLHFGHDAAAMVLSGGMVKSYVLRERTTRIKHALGLDMRSIEMALHEAGVDLGSVACVAISSTQCVELLVDDPARLKIEYTFTDSLSRPMSLHEELEGKDHNAISSRSSSMLLDLVYDSRLSKTYLGQTYRKVFPECTQYPRSYFEPTPWIDAFSDCQDWNAPLGLRDLASVTPVVSDHLRYGFHIPINVSIDGRNIPGYAINHHLAHAANAFYGSGFASAAIMTHDGFGMQPGYHSGMFYLGHDEAIYPLWPHHLGAGYMYEHTANSIGLGVGGGSGKLMGLAGHGQPTFYDSSFVGNYFDFQGKYRDVSKNWLFHCKTEASRRGYAMQDFADPTRATSPINADIAASTQRLLEETRLAATQALVSQLENAEIEVKNLCLSGGTALNCPSNSDIWNSGLFAGLYIDPDCDDSGIAVGAALVAFHSILGHPRVRTISTPYLGPRYSEADLERALSQVHDELSIDSPVDPVEEAANDLSNNRIIGWFEGRSECGPRALGHRSILADPRRPENSDRGNAVKDRETWRPFAPAVLAADAADWFDSVPEPSPYMLFNARVVTDSLPAVTHADGSARIQTVDASCGDFYHLLQAFKARTGVPVVLNTSLNGPGEPIVETPDDAVRALLARNLDALYIQGRRVTRR